MRFFILFVFLSFCVTSLEPVYAQGSGEAISTQDEDKPWLKKKKKTDKKKKKKQASASKSFKKMARELLGRPSWSDRFLNLLDQDVAKIAIHPFKEEDLPISLEEAQTYVDGFTRALVREADGRYAIVGRKELGAVVSDINEMGTRTESINPLGDLIARARSDLLAVGSLSLKGEKIILAYKLVETESGRIVSATQKSFKRKQGETQKVGGLSVKGAAQKASAQLMRDLVEVRKIMVEGLRYQTSGIHTGFGRYFMGLLSDGLRKQAASGPRNINDLSISAFEIEEERFRGLKLAKGSLNNQENQRQKRDYILKGTYWVFEQWVEIRLTLEGADGRSIAWRGRIVRSEIPESFELIPPPAPIDEEARKALGPIDLYVTSNKGDNPLFKIGQKMVLALRAQEDAYVSCYYFQADGAFFKIFPNRFMTSGKINGGFTQHIPSAGMPFAFEFSPPSGVEAVKCFATDVEVTKRLAPHIGKAAFEPLSLQNEHELTKIYRSLRDVTLSEASLIVTVQ
ncbi:exported hypothetical protein [Candidatus Terasakiella magnetica]|uniref:DUF4384 domain-containing protein n=1 Tax=Candidatus Terasakiella magnetica TaxID=1867952 RepID=A0A1C3RKL5_9PROT|nr:DUF4384 domain-containing protein [Candidatus Terasakiella magnetica]SCA57788.1 exported hypothetical protein [Candidatus Terasakiella magnetica]